MYRRNDKSKKRERKERFHFIDKVKIKKRIDLKKTCAEDRKRWRDRILQDHDTNSFYINFEELRLEKNLIKI